MFTFLTVEKDTPSCLYSWLWKRIHPHVYILDCGKGYTLMFTFLTVEKDTPSCLYSWLWKRIHYHGHPYTGGGKGHTPTSTLTIHPHFHTVDCGKWIHPHVHTMLLAQGYTVPSRPHWWHTLMPTLLTVKINIIGKDGQHGWQSMPIGFYAHPEYTLKNFTRTLSVCKKINVNTECAQKNLITPSVSKKN